MSHASFIVSSCPLHVRLDPVGLPVPSRWCRPAGSSSCCWQSLPRALCGSAGVLPPAPSRHSLWHGRLSVLLSGRCRCQPPVNPAGGVQRSWEVVGPARGGTWAIEARSPRQSWQTRPILDVLYVPSVRSPPQAPDCLLPAVALRLPLPHCCLRSGYHAPHHCVAHAPAYLPTVIAPSICIWIMHPMSCISYRRFRSTVVYIVADVTACVWRGVGEHVLLLLITCCSSCCVPHAAAGPRTGRGTTVPLPPCGAVGDSTYFLMLFPHCC